MKLKDLLKLVPEYSSLWIEDLAGNRLCDSQLYVLVEPYLDCELVSVSGDSYGYLVITIELSVRIKK